MVYHDHYADLYYLVRKEKWGEVMRDSGAWKKSKNLHHSP